MASLRYGVFTPEQDNDKTNVEPVHSHDAFHTRSGMPGVRGIIGMHRFNICLVVLSLSCSGVKTPLEFLVHLYNHIYAYSPLYMVPRLGCTGSTKFLFESRFYICEQVDSLSY